ncbi:hypothetical protein BDV96DRAFT_575351 [Lophiotrema nucula]|uniref:Protoporphyrinogen oxidase n=1 Tax=Lophiotrema nucula TaxID=690887 RepID=A0A6A5Z860_9PLEO|nr:hypothetical protein BDV96DRAFT_575351 [Lophiotrema nucula]
MRLKRHVALVESALTHVSSSRPLLCSQCSRRRHASSKADPDKIAILGGGVSGLASAYYVAKDFPNSKITIFEGKERLGGWIQSKKFDVSGGEVLFEYGPRTLRPVIGARPTVALVQDLDLAEEVLYTSKDAPAATNRYIYYPDRINRLPHPKDGNMLPAVFKCVQSGLFAGIWGVAAELWRPRRPLNVTDESVGSFISRRVDKRIAQNMASAVLHGIYAGDIWQLSAKTLFPVPWQLEGMYGSVVSGYFNINANDPRSETLSLFHPTDYEDARAMDVELKVDEKLGKDMSAASTFSFKNGLQTLMTKLEGRIRGNKQFEIKTGTAIHSLNKITGSEQVEVVSSSSKDTKSQPLDYTPPTTTTSSQADDPSLNRQPFDLVISTLPAPKLTPTVTVQVVNLYFPTPNLIPHKGFGYLIPESVPFEQNPERALGVIFDSDAIQGQDSVNGTKVTVMMGGRWWDDWVEYPSEEEGLENARSVLARHLGIREEPLAWNVSTNYNAIPQYTVGFEDRLKRFAEELGQRFHGRVRVVGNQFNGVGVNDCIRGAWSMARGLKNGGWKGRSVGLDRVLDPRPWSVEPVLRSTWSKA